MEITKFDIGVIVMQAIIDRFEGDYAVLELPDGAMRDVLRSRVSAEAGEGDAVEEDGGKYRILFTKEELEDYADLIT